MRRKLYVVGGSLSLGLGVLGVFLPLLPTTPFLLLSAACYMRGSPRLHDWLLNHRVFGSYIRNYREGRGLPLLTKVFTLTLLWVTLTYSGLMVMSLWWVRVLLAAVGMGVTIHLLKLPTLRK